MLELASVDWATFSTLATEQTIPPAAQSHLRSVDSQTFASDESGVLLTIKTPQHRSRRVR